MKKTIFLITAVLLFCNGMKAQDLANATLSFSTTTLPSFQLSLTDNLQTDAGSIYSIPMPESNLMINNQYSSQQYASRKGWGIASIITGGLTMLSGASVWVFADLFNSAASQMSEMSEWGDEPSIQEGQEAAQTIGNIVKTVGIVGTVVGAALVGTGIWLVSSDGGSSSRGRGYHRNHRRSSYKRRISDNMQPTFDMKPDWGLCLNTNGLTLVF